MKRLRRTLEQCRALCNLLDPSRKLRPTPEGWWFILLTVAVGGVAVNTGINLLYLILAMMLGFIAVSGVLSELSVRGVEVSLKLPRSVFSGEEFAVRVAVRNRKRRCASYSLRLGNPLSERPGAPESSSYVTYVPPREAVGFAYLARLARRGIHRVQGVELKTAYPFGLFEKSYLLPVEGSVLVYPALGEIKRLPPVPAARQRWEGEGEVAAVSGGLEFFGLRRYRPGDNPKWIHWRTSARTGTLMLREFEREQFEGVNILFDTSGPPMRGPTPPEHFELAVSYIATLVHHLAAQGRQVCLAAWPGSEEVVTTDGGLGADALLGLLALVEPSHGLESTDGWRAVGERLMPGTPLLVVGWSPEESDRPGRGFAGRDGPMTAVVNVQDPEFRRLFVSPAADEGY